jgi:mannosyltransferase OCH1-like enzyme
MIPKTIHHLWINSQNGTSNLSEIPPDVMDNLRSWQLLEVGYQQKVWSIEEILGFCELHKMPEIVQALSACRFPSMKADIARLLILKFFGGFWVDLKLRLNRRFLDRLVSHHLILTEHFAKDDLPIPNGRLSNSFIGARPNNPVIGQALISSVNNVNRRMGGSIYHVTGATNLEVALQSQSDQDNHFMIPHQTAWDYLFSIRGGSYNGKNMHWSIREQQESPYLD